MLRPALKKAVLGRRQALLSAAHVCGLVALDAACGAAPAPVRPVAAPARAPVELWSWYDLPDDPRSRELSGLAWEGPTRTLWSVQDQRPEIVALEPDPQLRSWRLGRTIRIRVDAPLDLEALVVTERGFLVSSEEGPRILELDRDGRLVRDIVLPPKLTEAMKNKSLESLAMSPDGRYLYTTSEAALPRDGPAASPERGTRVRILRLDRTNGGWTEHAYETDRAIANGHEYGVAELAALGDDRLLVLERGWAKGVGNTVRIYAVNLADSASTCSAIERLDARSPMLPKSLLVDLAAMPVGADVALPVLKQPQASPLLDNYEGLAVGPRLGDARGRGSLVLVSDDNGRTDQSARVLVLAVG